MIKGDLRAQGYLVEEKFPRPSAVNTLWAILTLIFIVGTFGGMLLYADSDIGPKGGGHGGPPPPDDTFIEALETVGKAVTFGLFDSEVAGYFVFAILMLFVYLFMKLFITVLFCRKSESIKLTLLESKGMPMCLCREALRVWQTVLIYLIPFVLMYSVYVFLCIRYMHKPAFLILFFFMLFFMVFDFTLVLLVLGVKIKSKPDYISIDRHLFGYTVFKKTYVKFSRRKKPNKN